MLPWFSYQSVVVERSTRNSTFPELNTINTHKKKRFNETHWHKLPLFHIFTIKFVHKTCTSLVKPCFWTSTSATLNYKWPQTLSSTCQNSLVSTACPPQLTCICLRQGWERHTNTSRLWSTLPLQPTFACHFNYSCSLPLLPWPVSPNLTPGSPVTQLSLLWSHHSLFLLAQKFSFSSICVPFFPGPQYTTEEHAHAGNKAFALSWFCTILCTVAFTVL